MSEAHLRSEHYIPSTSATAKANAPACLVVANEGPWSLLRWGYIESGSHPPPCQRDAHLTAQQAWEVLRAHGVSASQWALLNGFQPSLVYSILQGKRKCLRGQSFLIARALGMK